MHTQSHSPQHSKYVLIVFCVPGTGRCGSQHNLVSAPQTLMCWKRIPHSGRTPSLARDIEGPGCGPEFHHVELGLPICSVSDCAEWVCAALCWPYGGSDFPGRGGERGVGVGGIPPGSGLRARDRCLWSLAYGNLAEQTWRGRSGLKNSSPEF